MIITANKYFNEEFENYKIGALIPLMIKQGIMVKPGIDDSELPAFVNQGRWLVKCECGGAEFAWEEGLFMCQSCWNSAHKHNFRKSVFPKRRKQIEEMLEVRPLMNRNFLVTDTVEILQAENSEHKSDLLGVN
jgi:hypothetical protein